MTLADDLRAARATDELARWVEIWHRVCNAAQGDDDAPPPTWAEVVAKELPGWNMSGMSADQFGHYMKARLVHVVEDYLVAAGKHPFIAAASTQPQEPDNAQ